MNNSLAVKKLTAGALSAVMLLSALIPSSHESSSIAFSPLVASAVADDGVYVNFAEALQLSLYFYDANRCGEGITGGWLEWRGDCHVEDGEVPLQPIDESNYGTNLSQDWIDQYGSYIDPDGDGLLDLTGGWHDAGDHVKFGLPGAYAASTVGWGYYEFRNAYIESGQQAHVEDILRWINDYYMKVTYLDENGDLIAYCYQVGEGSIDHNYWNAPELQNTTLLDYARPAYFANSEAPAVDQCCEAAASLAVHYLNFKDTDPEYSQEALTKALALYDFALKYYEPDTVDGGPAGYDGGFYESSCCYDEYAWAAVWLYYCTNDYDYIDQIISVSDVANENGSYDYTGYLKRIIADTGNCWQNIWVHCWDTVWGGVFAKLAPVTNTARDWYIFRWNLEFWSGIEHQYVGDVTKLWNAEYVPNNDTEDGAFIARSAEGFPMLNNYGSCRYGTAAQMCALVYAKYTPDQDNLRFARWAMNDMIYIMGDNPMNYSYIVGYSDAYASHPHHRASHGSLTLNMDDPVDQTHVLWGALVGGPDADDYHHDVTSDYIYNEVAVDYNAGFTGACAGLYEYFGKDSGIVDSSEPRENFPPPENADGSLLEFSVAAKLEQENAERTQVSIEFTGNTKLPPRYVDTYKVRYFFDVSELLAAGQTIDDLTVDVYYDQNEASYDGPAAVSKPIEWDEAGTYYVELDWSGYDIFGTREIQIGLIVSQDANYNSNWDPTNDYSRENITEVYADTEKICMYVDDELVWGIEPEKKQNGGGNTETPKAILTASSLHSALDGEMSDICASIQVDNSGTAAVDLTDLTVRYWFSDDYNADLDYCIDYAKVGEANVTGRFVKLTDTTETADSYFELGFTGEAGVLGASGTTGAVQFRIIDNAYATFSQANDYSYNAMEAFTVNPTVTVYVDGVLVYGVEPVETSLSVSLLGDVNCDKLVDVRDVAMLAKAAAGVITLSEQSKLNGDLNSDTNINVIDVAKLAKTVAGLLIL